MIRISFKDFKNLAKKAYRIHKDQIEEIDHHVCRHCALNYVVKYINDVTNTDYNCEDITLKFEDFYKNCEELCYRINKATLDLINASDRNTIKI